MLKECLAINGHRNRNRTMYRLNRIAVILLGFAILIQVEIAQSLAADGPTYDTVEVVGKDSPFVETLELRGATVHGYETTDVMSKLAGYVSKIHDVGVDGDGGPADIGSVVKKDQVLVELFVPEMMDEMAEKMAELGQAKAAVDQAVAAVKEADAEVDTRVAEVQQAMAMAKQKDAMRSYRQQQFELVSSLFKTGVVDSGSKIEAQFALDAARAEFVVGADNKEFYPGVRIAEAHARAATAAKDRSVADLELAKQKVNVAAAGIAKLKTMQRYTMIKAPFSGIVTRRMVDHGAFVRPPSNSGAMPLFTITRIDKVRVVVSVPNNKATKARKGQAVVLDRLGGLKGVAIQGQVSRIANVLEKGSRMMRIEVDIQNPAVDVFTKAKIFLRPGLYGTVNVRIKDHGAIPLVPTKSVSTDSDGRDFVVVIRDGKPVKQSVEIAYDDAITIGLSNGVKIGDQVLRNAAAY
jgi:RND family efflux transporter MFP subunit